MPSAPLRFSELGDHRQLTGLGRASVLPHASLNHRSAGGWWRRSCLKGFCLVFEKTRPASDFSPGVLKPRTSTPWVTGFATGSPITRIAVRIPPMQVPRSTHQVCIDAHLLCCAHHISLRRTEAFSCLACFDLLLRTAKDAAPCCDHLLRMTCNRE